MHSVTGGCHCGNIAIEMDLTEAPDAYGPRACDCDFCRKHGAAWVSDPRGSLAVRVRNAETLGRYFQGSGQAGLLFCKTCGVVVCVVHRREGSIHAAANAAAIDSRFHFGPAQLVSPQRLSPSEKAARWRELWFSQVEIHEP